MQKWQNIELNVTFTESNLVTAETVINTFRALCHSYIHVDLHVYSPSLYGANVSKNATNFTSYFLRNQKASVLCYWSTVVYCLGQKALTGSQKVLTDVLYWYAASPVFGTYTLTPSRFYV